MTRCLWSIKRGSGLIVSLQRLDWIAVMVPLVQMIPRGENTEHKKPMTTNKCFIMFYYVLS